MELTNTMIEAGAEYLCGFSKEKAKQLEEEEEFLASCREARELFTVMMHAATTEDTQNQRLQDQLAAGEPVNDNPNMW